MLELFLIAVGLALVFGLLGFTRIAVGFMAVARIVFLDLCSGILSSLVDGHPFGVRSYAAGSP
jgi:branched-subunit amino acid ABC-type transport system permease component